MYLIYPKNYFIDKQDIKKTNEHFNYYKLKSI